MSNFDLRSRLKKRRRKAKSREKALLQVESLEERCVLTDFFGFAYYDFNGDGSFSASEDLPLANLDINLTSGGTDGLLATTGDNFTVSVGVDVNGSYGLAGLPNTGEFELFIDPGDVTALDGGTRSYTFLGTPGTIVQDFALQGTASISGNVYRDLDGDTNLNGKDFGIDGVVLDHEFTIGGTTLTKSVTTDANGDYTIDGLVAEYIDPLGIIDTTGEHTLTVDPGTLPLTVGSRLSASTTQITTDGVMVTGRNFYNLGDGSLGGTIFLDSNNDGVFDAEEDGLAGVPILLFWDVDEDGNFGGLNDIVYSSTTTDANGQYIFDLLWDGDYRVEIPTGYLLGAGLSGTPTTDDFTLTGGDDNVQNFALIGNNTITGTVYADLDGDRLQGFSTPSDEPALAGVDVIVQGDFDGIPGYGTSSGDFYYVVTTDSNGDYSFDFLPAGDYLVEVDTATLPDGYSVGSLTPLTRTILGPSETVFWDFGIFGTATQSGIIFYDQNGNGTYEPEELPYENADITLIWDGGDNIFGNGNDGTYTISTLPDGTYGFELLLDGVYELAVDFGTLPTYANLGTYSKFFVVNSGTTAPAPTDFPFYGNNEIDVSVFYDLIDNDIQDFNEAGLGGYTVDILWDGNDGIFFNPGGTSFSMTTDTSGHALLSGLADGMYRITVNSESIDISVSGGSLELADFDIEGTLTINGLAFYDEDNNGTFDGSDYELEGIPVSLVWGGVDGDLSTTADNIILSSTTGTGSNAGEYSFESLMPGAYRVTVEPPAALSNPVSVDFDPLSASTTQDFAIAGSASVSGNVFYDFDQNGSQNGAEPNLPAFTVTLEWAGLDDDFGNTADNQTYNLATDPTGNYLFENLAAGDYQIYVEGVLEDSFTLTTSTASLTGLSLAFVGGGSVSGHLFYDLSGDGSQNFNEPSLTNTTFHLIWAGLDDTFGTTDDLTRLVTSDSLGDYFADGLLLDTNNHYRVELVPSFLPSDLQNIGPASDFSPTSGTPVITGQDLYTRGGGDITGTVFYDFNNDSIHNNNEPLLDGVRVVLTWFGFDGVISSDDVAIETYTDSLGAYGFDFLADGNYEVAIDNTTLPSDLQGGTLLYNLTLGGTMQSQVQDFTPFGLGSIDGSLWHDFFQNGSYDLGEQLLDGVTIQLTWAGPDDSLATTGDNQVITTTTGSVLGNYFFGGLADGNYEVQVIAATLPTVFTGTTIVNPTLSLGDRNQTEDFFYVGLSSIGDTVFYDINGNGTQDTGEPGLENVTVELIWSVDGIFGNGDDLSYTTTTDANGNYLFENQRDGLYRVVVDTGTLPTDISSGTPSQDVNLPSLADDLAIDFAFRGTNTVDGIVFYDFIDNDVLDTNEIGIASESVTIEWDGGDGTFGDGDEPPAWTLVTDGNGQVSATGLADGQYRLTANGVSRIVTVTGGATETAFIPYSGTLSIDGLVFYDADRDDTFTAGDYGLESQAIYLVWGGADGMISTTSDNITISTFTGSGATAGEYAFDNLLPDTYQIYLQPPPALSNLILVDFDPLTASTTEDFPISGQGVVSGNVFYDFDLDTSQTGLEPALANYSVALVWAGLDDTFGSGGDDETYNLLTDGSGNFSFADLAAGDYELYVEGELQRTFSLSSPTDTLTGLSIDYTGPGSILGNVFYDLSGDATKNVNEPGLGGAQVLLTWAGLDEMFGTADDISRTVTADAAGDYLADGLLVDDANLYRVEIIAASLPTDLQSIGPAATASPTSGAPVITGQDLYTRGGGDITGTVFYDFNNDSIHNNNEPLLDGVRVVLTWFGFDGVISSDDVTIETYTDSLGAYGFDFLADGNYEVAIDNTTLPSDLQGGTLLYNLTLGGTMQSQVQDFTPFGLGSIDGSLWHDFFQNGSYDLGEQLLGGVTIQLTWAGPDDSLATTGDNQVITTTTGSVLGNYFFSGLADGNYEVQVIAATLPTVFTGTTIVNPTLSLGDRNQTEDFFYVGLSSIGDTVFYDINGNGTQDTGEPGLENVTVELIWSVDGIFGNGDDLSYTTTTDANGNYLFENQRDGLYRVVVDTGTLPTDISSGTPSQDVNLPSAASDLTIDFAFRGTNTVDGLVFYDFIDNDVLDTNEIGIASESVTIEWDGGDGTFGDGDEPPAWTLVTDSNGQVSATGLADGQYRLTANGVSRIVTVTGGATETAFIPYSGTLTIDGLAFHDHDNNGLFGTGDDPLPSLTTRLIWGGADNDVSTVGDNIVLVTQTGVGANEGEYSFSGLLSGQYRIEVDPPTQLAGPDGFTFNLTGDVTQDFPFGGQGEVSGSVYYDFDQNGSRAFNESYLENITVTLEWAGFDNDFSGTADNEIYTTLSDGSGNFSFGMLAGGMYRLSVNGDLTTFTLASPTDIQTGFELGYEGQASAGGTVFYDLTGDGTQNNNEPGLSGNLVRVIWSGLDEIVGTGDDLVKSVTADANGDYLADGLLVNRGEYVIGLNVGNLPSDINNAGLPHFLTPMSTGLTPDQDLFAFGNGEVEGTVFYDFDQDGLQNGEPLLDNVRILLTWAGLDGILGNSDDVYDETFTDSLGYYSFDWLADGDYTIDIDTTTLPNDLQGGTTSIATTFIPGDREQVRDFPVLGEGTISGIVWYDFFRNGTFDTGETLLENLQIILTWAGEDGDLGTTSDNLSISTTTGSLGDYYFDALADGLYQIEIFVDSLPADLQNGLLLDTTTLDSGDGIFPPDRDKIVDLYTIGSGSIGDLVWYDLNGDGLQNNNEPGLSGVSIDLIWAGEDGVLDTADDLSLTTTTDSDGLYSFDEIRDGLYRVVVETLTLPSDITIGTSIQEVTLINSTVRTDVDFAFRGEGTIGDTVWVDFNGNGIQDNNEPGLANVQLEITWDGGDGLFINGNEVTAIVTTDSNGNYLFDGLADGNYRIDILPASLPSDIDPNTPTLSTSISSGSLTDLDVDFPVYGLYDAAGELWFDLNANGLFDVDESPMTSFQVVLQWAGFDLTYGTADDVFLETTTDSNGQYSFDSLINGTYRVAATGLSALDLVTSFEADDASPFPGDLDGFALFEVAGTSRPGIDLGYRGQREISGFVFYDVNNDGIKDLGEPGLFDVELELTFAGLDGIFGTSDDVTLGVPLVTSSAGATLGQYLQANLPNGDYRITVDSLTIPSGFTLTSEVDDPIFGGSVDGTAEISVSGVDRSGINFGYRGNFTLGDRVWFDENGDGVQDVNEPGLGNLTVLLTYAGQDGIFGTIDDVSQSTVTGSNGDYSFDLLPTGDYQIEVDLSFLPPFSSDFTPTFDQDDDTPVLDGVANITLHPDNSPRLDVDFGFQGASTLGDLVWYDANNNGIFDTGETPLANVELILVWAGRDGDFNTSIDNFTKTITTDAFGQYTFENLFSGAYRLTVNDATLPNGLIFGIDADGGQDGTTVVTLGSGETNTAIDFALLPEADMRLSQNVTFGGVPGDTNQPTTFQFALTNAGFGTASTVVIDGELALNGIPITHLASSLPTVTLLSATANGSPITVTFSVVAQVGTGYQIIIDQPLPSSAILVFQVQLSTDSSARGTLSNSLVVSASNEPDLAVNSLNEDEDTAVLIPQSDMVIDHISSDSAVPGSSTDQAVFIFDVTNLGPSDATGVVIDQFLSWPEDAISVTLISVTSSLSTPLPAVGFTFDSNTLQILLDDPLISGATARFQVEVQVPFYATGVLSHSIFVSSTDEPASQVDSFNESNADATLTPQADVLIEQTVQVVKLTPNGQAQVTPNAVPGQDQVIFTITVYNDGPSRASLVELSELFPEGVIIQSVTSSAPSQSSPQILFDGTNYRVVDTISNLDPNGQPGSSITYTITATLAPDLRGDDGVVEQTATVTLGNNVQELDPLTNMATSSFTVTPVTSLRVEITDNVDSAIPGSQHTYTLKITNDGPSTAIDAFVLLSLPDAFFTEYAVSPKFTKLVTVGDTSTAISNFLILEGDVSQTSNGFVTLGPNNQLIYTITGTLDPSARGEIEAEATIAAPNDGLTVDPNSSDNFGDDQTELTPKYDLVVQTFDDGVDVLVDEATTYTITIVNNGTSTAIGAIISSPFPEQGLPGSGSWVLLASATDRASASNNAGGDDLNETITILPGGTITFLRTLSVNRDNSQLITTVTVTPQGTEENPEDINLANNSKEDRNLLQITGDTAEGFGQFSDALTNQFVVEINVFTNVATYQQEYIRIENNIEFLNLTDSESLLDQIELRIYLVNENGDGEKLVITQTLATEDNKIDYERLKFLPPGEYRIAIYVRDAEGDSEIDLYEGRLPLTKNARLAFQGRLKSGILDRGIRPPLDNDSLSLIQENPEEGESSEEGENTDSQSSQVEEVEAWLAELQRWWSQWSKEVEIPLEENFGQVDWERLGLDSLILSLAGDWTDWIAEAAEQFSQTEQDSSDRRQAATPESEPTQKTTSSQEPGSEDLSQLDLGSLQADNLIQAVMVTTVGAGVAMAMQGQAASHRKSQKQRGDLFARVENWLN
ncbi:Hypothetical protein PBC10988_26000 [Planctomycetales bacterium 10988]|nr:Hypothetical protein PBC10988_26000 [Planctomycetales bacterium 10988]